jgi:S-adenosylmethionine synthetase
VNISEEYVFTSESVTEGHPDKFCDQIEVRKQSDNRVYPGGRAW